MKLEQKFTTKFKHWLHSQDDYGTAAWEFKVVNNGTSFPFSDVQPHQEQALLAVSQNLFCFKIPDDGLQKPFDMFTMRKECAYVVIAFLEKRKPTRVFILSILTFQNLRDNHERKSIKPEELSCFVKTKENCQEIIF